MLHKKAVIYCSASYTIDPKYNQAAREVVRAACLCGYGIVSGGTVKGTMGVVCEEALKHDVEVIGVVPRFMKDLVYPGMTTTIWTDTMSERKQLMREGCSLAIALPGGIGTLDEVIETLVLVKLAKYDGKVIFYNAYGFYEPVKALLDHYVATEMLTPEDRKLAYFPETIEQFRELL